MEYTKNVSEPWFSLILLNIKTVEGRLNKGDFKAMKKGDIINWTNNNFGYERSFATKIVKITNYDNFASYLTTEKLPNCLPGIDTVNHGVNGVYYKYFTPEDETTYGVVAIKVKTLLYKK
jgi:ASC-1-like (ASCH) protein